MRAVGAVVLVSLVLTAVAQLDWKRFTYPDGNFSILFPSTPQKRIGDGRRLMFVAVTGRESYRISYTDYPAGTVWEKTVNDERDAILKVTLGEVMREERTSIEGCPGKWIRFVGRDVIGELAIYFVGQRLYLLQALAPKNEPRPLGFSTFLNSFRLLSRPKHNEFAYFASRAIRAMTC